MALPGQLKTARLTDASLANTIDDAGLGAMEQAIADILGIPVNTNITKALFLVAAGGLKIVKLIDNAADPTVDGEIVMNANDLKVRLGGVVKTLQDQSAFASGVRIAGFDQDAAPTGWTRKNVTGERLIKLARSGDTAQTEAGTWTVGGITVDSHVLITTEMPAHTHDITLLALFTGSGTNEVAYGALSPFGTKTTTSTGGGGGHIHGLTSDGTWRPANRIIIIAQKD